MNHLHLDIQSKTGIASGAGAGLLKSLTSSVGIITWSGILETAVYASIGAAVGLLTTWLIRLAIKFLKSKL